MKEKKLSAYQEKLLDPRWQRKRLEIFQRDTWTYQRCGDTTTTLHVHHRYYEWPKEPWDYPDQALVTLCATCHEKEKNTQTVAEAQQVHEPAGEMIEEEDDERRPYEDLEQACLYANDYNHPTIALTMIALLRQGYAYTESFSTVEYYLNFEEMRVITRLPMTTILSHILKIHDTKTLALAWDTHCAAFEYSFDIGVLEGMEPWELWQR